MEIEGLFRQKASGELMRKKRARFALLKGHHGCHGKNHMEEGGVEGRESS